MRFFTFVLSVLLSQASLADTTMEQLQASIDSLTKAIGSLQTSLGPAQDSLAKASNALVVLGNFSTTVQNNVTPIALASVGVLAAGIVLGSFAVIGIKQAFFAMQGCWRLRQAPEIFLGN